jgi:hypothetical protein
MPREPHVEPNGPTRPSGEWRVLVVVAIVLGITELTMARLETSLSRDCVHLKNMPSIAQRLSHNADANSTRVLFVGNSLVREGILPEVLQQAVSDELQRACTVERIHPDNTALAEWFYAIDRFVLEQGNYPDLILIGFQGSHLRDAPSRHAARLHRYYCGWGQVDSLARYDLHHFESWCHFEIDGSFAALANRERVERKVLDKWIPHYRTGIQTLNGWQNHVQSQQSQPTYDRLRELVERVRNKDIPLILVEMPVAKPEPLDSELISLCNELSVTLVDFHDLPALPEGSFPDGLHMNRAAAEIVSRSLATKLNWPSSSQR